MRLLHLVAAGLLAAIGLAGVEAGTPPLATFEKPALDQRFLLQVSYEQQHGRQDFQTSRSRIVVFQRSGAVLDMLDASGSGSPSQVLATIPIRHETESTLDVDLNKLNRRYADARRAR